MSENQFPHLGTPESKNMIKMSNRLLNDPFYNPSIEEMMEVINRYRTVFKMTQATMMVDDKSSVVDVPQIIGRIKRVNDPLLQGDSPLPPPQGDGPLPPQ